MALLGWLPLSAGKEELMVYARRWYVPPLAVSFSSPTLIRLCDEITASNYLLSASWIAQ
jgi:hypothetical protein